MYKNNDINLTATCLHVDFSKDILFEFQVSPQFWQFYFDEKGKEEGETN